MLFKLAGDRIFDGMVTAVMRTWCHFIDQDFIGLGPEKLNSKQTADFKCLHCFSCYLYYFFPDSWWNVSRGIEIIQHVLIIKYHFDRIICENLSGLITCHDDSQFFFDISQLFCDRWYLQQMIKILVMFYNVDSTTVVPFASAFLYKRKRKLSLLNGIYQVSFGFIFFELYSRKIMGTEELILKIFILDDLQHSRTRVHFHSFFFQDRKSTRLNSSHVAISYAVFCLKKKKT